MPNLSKEDYEHWKRKNNIQARAAGFPASFPEPIAGEALDNVLPGEEKGEESLERGNTARYHITFTYYSATPCDYDNYRSKPLQDLLVAAGIIPGDDWKTLQGTVISRKCKPGEERTEIEIVEL